jgi:hypothetical protein
MITLIVVTQKVTHVAATAYDDLPLPRRFILTKVNDGQVVR